MGFLDAFGGAGASVEDITAGRSTVAGESIDHGEDQRQAIAETAAAISAQQQQDAQNFMQPQMAAPQQDMGMVQSRTGINVPGVYGQAQMGRPFQPYAQLFQQGLPSTVTAGFAAGTRPLSQLMARQNYSPLPNVGLMGALPNTATGILERLEAGGKPVYDPTGQIVGVMGEGLFGGEAYFGRPGFDPLQGGSQRLEDERGALMGYQSVGYTGDMGSDDDGGESPLPGVPTTAAVTQAAPEAPRAAPEYIYPEGGFFPETGRYYRRGLLDIDPGGLLDFTARNEAFRRGMATDASLYGMPYDLSGYTLLA